MNYDEIRLVLKTFASDDLYDPTKTAKAIQEYAQKLFIALPQYDVLVRSRIIDNDVKVKVDFIERIY